MPLHSSLSLNELQIYQRKLCRRSCSSVHILDCAFLLPPALTRVLFSPYLKAVKFRYGATSVFHSGVRNQGHPYGRSTCSGGRCLCLPLSFKSKTTFAGTANASIKQNTCGQKRCGKAADRSELWPNLAPPENPRRFKLWHFTLWPF